jgi:AsmA protein
MLSRHKTLAIILGSIIALILLVIIAVPMFLNADSFRTRIENELTTALGRKVVLGKLDLSVWSGSLVAQNATVADDPAYGSEPFLQAKEVRIGVRMMPLIFSQKVSIDGFAIDSPTVNVIRHANGSWNYSTIGAANKQKPAAKKDSDSPDIDVSKAAITNGTLHVATESAPGQPVTAKRTYEKVNLEARNFTFDRQFPYNATAQLPGGGELSIAGNAGPINGDDASLTPFSAKLTVKHLDPTTGTIDAIDLTATWNGQQLHVNNLVVDTPKLTVVRDNKPTTQPAKKNEPSSSDMLSTFSADHLEIKNGSLTLTSPGQSTPAVYQQLHAEINNVSPTASSPFKASAQIPGGGSLTADGNAGPLNQQNLSATPFNAHAAFNHVDLASSGIVAPSAGIKGLANIDAKGVSDGTNLNANVSVNAQNLQLAANGSPSQKPVAVQMTVAQNMQALTGQVQKAVITVGRAAVDIAGTYQTSGPTTAINLKVNSNAAPIDELEAFLPSVGVHLPSGSRLQGGTLTANLAVTGSTAAPIISGPIRLDNTNLANFDLGSKLSAITSLTGAKTGSTTAIRSLSTNINVNGGNVRTDNLALNMPALGTATGAGTVAASGALNYNVILKLTGLLGGGSGGNQAAAGIGGIAGSLMSMIPSTGAAGIAAGTASGFATSALRNGVPVAIGGTTSNPTFTPNLSGAMASGAKSFTSAPAGKSKQQNATDPLSNALGGLLNRKR